ncbi:DUF1652 domain-containing protein [Pseudomonas coronafaciens pv. oryzae str. 1_6]|nr:DUF1652 domain-containing protein [Pseudomonas coronafaciens pv. oryzae str. 1_6]
MRCFCTISPFNVMTVQIIDSQTGDEEFSVTSIDTTPLTLISTKDRGQVLSAVCSGRRNCATVTPCV